MEKLEKVIAGIECCWIRDDLCRGCPYKGSAEDGGCGRNLELDTLEVLKELSTDNQRLREMWAEATKNLSMAIAERDEARKEIMKLEAENDNLRKDIGTLSRINADWRAEVGRLHKRIDDARAEGLRVSGVAEKPGTNYQKLVKMGPLYLADWIYRKVRPCECCDHYGMCGIPEDEVNDEYCLEHILMWLAQEA